MLNNFHQTCYKYNGANSHQGSNTDQLESFTNGNIYLSTPKRNVYYYRQIILHL